jgi:hypothetical protein
MLDELKKISPLVAKAVTNPNFRIRKIEREAPKKARGDRYSNQKNIIRQGYAGYLDDLNEFNTDF